MSAAILAASSGLPRRIYESTKTLAAQFAPQHSHAEQSETKHRDCRAAIGHSLDTRSGLGDATRKKIRAHATFCAGMSHSIVAEFFRLQDASKRLDKAQKIRVTGYFMWDVDHNGTADVGSTIQYFGTNGFHHPWRSTAWEIHPIIKIEVME